MKELLYQSKTAIHHTIYDTSCYKDKKKYFLSSYLLRMKPGSP